MCLATSAGLNLVKLEGIIIINDARLLDLLTTHTYLANTPRMPNFPSKKSGQLQFTHGHASPSRPTPHAKLNKLTLSDDATMAFRKQAASCAPRCRRQCKCKFAQRSSGDSLPNIVRGKMVQEVIVHMSARGSYLSPTTMSNMSDMFMFGSA